MFERQLEPTTKAVLRDGRAIEIRPLDAQDSAALLEFGRALPSDDLLYTKDDFASQETIARLLNAQFAENWRQFIAVIDGAIVGYGAARRLPGWSSHVADIHVVVSASWRRLGVATALAQAIFDAARDLRADKLVAEMLEQQIAGQEICKRLGFRVEGTFNNHARDRHGQHHTLIVMANRLL
jgi:RimJ/RimL family protein N-acetyltransferase